MNDDELFPRASVLRKVLAFTFRHWARTPLPALACAGAMMLGTLTEVFVPLYAGRMIDAVGGGDASLAWWSFAAIAALGCAMVVLRHLGWWSIVPLTLTMMGTVGIAVAILLFVVIGNPSAGGAVPAALLPTFWRTVGPWLPNGAATEAVRSAVYFDAAGIGGPVLVIAAWAVAGAVLTMGASWVLHRRSVTTG